jgi:hypothetical protein
MQMAVNRMSLNIIGLIVLAFLALSCERIIEFKGSESDPKLVVYSLLQPDSVITVSIARSYPVFEENYGPEQITDAVVKLYCDDVFKETLTYVAPEPRQNYYPVDPYSRYISSGVKPVYGSTYRIEVEAEGLRPVVAEAVLPELVPIIKIDTMETVQQDGNLILVLKIRFHDPAGTDNMYRLKAVRTDGKYSGNKSQPFDPLIPVYVTESDCGYGAYDEPLIAPRQEEDIFGMFMTNTYNLFSDELISGRDYDLTFKIDHIIPDTDYFEFSYFCIELQSVTKDLYLYLLSFSAYNQTRDNFLSEPVLVYTNVANGLGVFGALSSSADTIRIGEYPADGVIYEYNMY